MLKSDQTAITRVNFNVARPPSKLLDTRLGRSAFLSGEEQHVLEDALASSRMILGGQDLMREGERADTVYIVSDGWACRYTTTRDGGRQISALLIPGDVVNLDSLLFDRLDYGVRTLTKATFLAFPRDRALTLAAQYPGIARTLTWLAMVENAILGKWTLSLGRRSSRERLAHLLCELSVRLEGETGDESRFEFPATQEQIADALGLTSVHVNRTMQQLRMEGVVKTENRTIVIPDVHRLRQIAGFDPCYLHAAPVPARLVNL